VTRDTYFNSVARVRQLQLGFLVFTVLVSPNKSLGIVAAKLLTEIIHESAAAAAAAASVITI